MKLSKSYLKKLIKEELNNVLNEDDFLRDPPEKGMGYKNNLPQSEKIEIYRKHVSNEGGMPVVNAEGMNMDDIMAMYSILNVGDKSWYDTTGAKFVNVSQQAADKLSKQGYSFNAGENVIGGK